MTVFSSRKRRRPIALDSEDEEPTQSTLKTGTTTKSLGSMMAVLGSDSESDRQAPIASRLRNSTRAKRTKAIDLESESEEELVLSTHPSKGSPTLSAKQLPSTSNSKSTAQRPFPLPARARPRTQRTWASADLTGDDDEAPIQYKEMTEDDARAMCGLPPREKAEVSLLDNDDGGEEDTEEQEDQEAEEDEDDQPPTKRRRIRLWLQK